MELLIATGELQRALDRVRGITEKKTTMPVLANVLLSAAKGTGLTVTGFDLDIAAVSSHPADVRTAGAVCINAALLNDIVSQAPDAEVRLRKNGTRMEITSGSSSFKVAYLPGADFPQLPKEEAVDMATLSSDALLGMLQTVQHAISQDESRYVINGVYVEQQKTRLCMAATDGHRLAVVTRELAEVPGLRKSGRILPRKAVLTLARLLKEGGESTCELGFSDSMAFFKRPGMSLLARLIDGQFPEYQRVIPPKRDAILVPRARFEDALKRVALLSSDKSNAIRVDFAQGKLSVSANNMEVGEGRDTVEVSYEGPKLEVGFNARYLLDALAVVGQDEVALEVGDEQSPGVLRVPGESDVTCVVMPMRV